MGTTITSCARCGITVVYNSNGFIVEEYGGRLGLGYRKVEGYSGVLCPECGDGHVPAGEALHKRMIANLPELDWWADLSAESRYNWASLFQREGVALPEEYAKYPAVAPVDGAVADADTWLDRGAGFDTSRPSIETLVDDLVSRLGRKHRLDENMRETLEWRFTQAMEKGATIGSVEHLANVFLGMLYAGEEKKGPGGNPF